jgi:hypothetical protein
MTRNDNSAPDTDIEVRLSPIHGTGLFARKAFEPGEIVLRWNLSQLIPKDEFALLSPAEQHYTHPFDDDRLILVQPPERFVNHSCNHNTEVRDFCDVAIRRISPGEEITSSYSSDGSESRFVCACGSENCRGRVS